MTYTDYLRLEGRSSIALGIVLAAVAVAGLSVQDARALLLGPSLVVLLAVIGVRAGAKLTRPAEWLATDLCVAPPPDATRSPRPRYAGAC